MGNYGIQYVGSMPSFFWKNLKIYLFFNTYIQKGSRGFVLYVLI